MLFYNDVMFLFTLHLRRCNRIAKLFCFCYRYRAAIELQTKCYRHFALWSCVRTYRCVLSICFLAIVRYFCLASSIMRIHISMIYTYNVCSCVYVCKCIHPQYASCSTRQITRLLLTKQQTIVNQTWALSNRFDFGHSLDYWSMRFLCAQTDKDVCVCTHFYGT